MEIQSGADYIADFIAKRINSKVFVVNGGACSAIIDAVGRHSQLDYICFQHEQSAAMAADAVWRTSQKIGVTISTSGPGATNLITGIACSWFDSIPAIHITGNVNQDNSKEAFNANVRQAGFQETDIVQMVSGITKWSHKVSSMEDLVESLERALNAAMSGRKGPVLIDIPMNLQNSECTAHDQLVNKQAIIEEISTNIDITNQINDFFKNCERPLIIFGAGMGYSGNIQKVEHWCQENSIPYVSSWGGISMVDRKHENYLGTFGVYGDRIANVAIQSADRILVLGSRLDERQRTSNFEAFAPFAKILVIDIDEEELKKFKICQNYQSIKLDLRNLNSVSNWRWDRNENWIQKLNHFRITYSRGHSLSKEPNTINPYEALEIIWSKIKIGSIIVADTGANLCWTYQTFPSIPHQLFTAAGNSPMGYSLPAAIGAQVMNPLTPVYCFIGDGGLQMNIQELQTIFAYQLPIKVILFNNNGYGIIKQFQDANFDGRYFASGIGYSIPDFKIISEAYKLPYYKVDDFKVLKELVIPENSCIIEIVVPSNALTSPKVEYDHFIHDQFPYNLDDLVSKLPYSYPNSPRNLRS